MTIEKLLEELERKRVVLDAVISEIRQYRVHTNTRQKAKEIVESVAANNKGYRYKKGTHWTQRPENKEKLRKMLSRPRQK